MSALRPDSGHLAVMDGTIARRYLLRKLVGSKYRVPKIRVPSKLLALNIDNKAAEQSARLGEYGSLPGVAGSPAPSSLTGHVWFGRRSSTRLTWTADHSPSPFAVPMPRSFSPAAMARSDVTPLACGSWIVGANSRRSRPSPSPVRWPSAPGRAARSTHRGRRRQAACAGASRAAS
jgi:hypothetical protein